MDCFWTDLSGLAEQECGGDAPGVPYFLSLENSNFYGQWALFDDERTETEPPEGFDMAADFVIDAGGETFLMQYQPEEARHQSEAWVGCDGEPAPITITQGGQSWPAYWSRGCT